MLINLAFLNEIMKFYLQIFFYKIIPFDYLSYLKIYILNLIIVIVINNL